jgi:hypothetical protein
MSEPDELEQESSPYDELLRLLGTQDDPTAFIEALDFLDGILTHTMLEFQRRFPAPFHAWCEENDIDEDAINEVKQQLEEGDDAPSGRADDAG